MSSTVSADRTGLLADLPPLREPRLWSEWTVVLAVVGVLTGWLSAPDVDAPVFRVMLVVLALAAATDVVAYRIPNYLSAAAGVVAVTAWLLSGAPWVPALVTVVFAIILIGVYLVADLGGGDVKLLPSVMLVLLLPSSDLMVAVTVGSLFMFLVSVSALVTHILVGAGRGVSPLAPGMLLGGVALLHVAGAVSGTPWGFIVLA